MTPKKKGGAAPSLKLSPLIFNFMHNLLAVVLASDKSNIVMRGTREECKSYLRKQGKNWVKYDLRYINKDGSLGMLASFVL